MENALTMSMNELEDHSKLLWHFYATETYKWSWSHAELHSDITSKLGCDVDDDNHDEKIELKVKYVFAKERKWIWINSFETTKFLFRECLLEKTNKGESEKQKILVRR